jgi:hypothetical protein
MRVGLLAKDSSSRGYDWLMGDMYSVSLFTELTDDDRPSVTRASGNLEKREWPSGEWTTPGEYPTLPQLL